MKGQNCALCYAQHSTHINCFQGIFQISSLLRLFITLPCKNPFFLNYCWRKITKRLFRCLAQNCQRKSLFTGSDAESRGLPAHSGRQKTPEITSFPWEAVWSECMTLAVCGIEMNAITDLGKIKEWASQRRDLLTEALSVLKHFTRKSTLLIMSNRRLCIWRFLKWLTLKRADGVKEFPYLNLLVQSWELPERAMHYY